MQKKRHKSWLALLMLLVMVILSFTVACKNKMEQAKKHFDQALMHEEQKMPDDAIREYKQAIQMVPDYADAHFRLGALYHVLNAYPSAIEEYQKVLRINPSYPGIHTALGHVYYVRGLKAWARAMNIDRLNYWQADTLRQLPYKDRAELVKLTEEYQNKLKADTADAETLSKLSQAYYVLAVEEYQKAIQANSSDTSAQLYLGLTYSEQEYPYKAMAQYEILKKLDPRAADLLQTMLKQKEKDDQYFQEMKKKAK